MKLITEMVEDVNLLVENKDGVKHYYIEGVFMQAEQKNRNGRIYPTAHIAPAVEKYVTEYVNKNRAMGELNHPSGPTVNLDKVSHIIKELKTDGNNFVGKSKVLDTPMGMSSRGMGSLKRNSGGINEVQKDFVLSAVDIVADPSAPDAFVNGILEGKEWVWDNGLLREQQIAQYEKQIKQASRKNLQETALNAFKDFLTKL